MLEFSTPAHTNYERIDERRFAMPHAVFCGFGTRGEVTEDSFKKILETIAPHTSLRFNSHKGCAFIEAGSAELAERFVAKLNGRFVGQSRFRAALSNDSADQQQRHHAAAAGEMEKKKAKTAWDENEEDAVATAVAKPSPRTVAAAHNTNISPHHHHSQASQQQQYRYRAGASFAHAAAGRGGRGFSSQYAGRGRGFR